MTTITMETQDRRRRLASLRAAAVGNALEWFDWTLYGTFSAYLAMNLFDPSDPTSALLATLAVFAGGFWRGPSAAGCSAASATAMDASSPWS